MKQFLKINIGEGAAVIEVRMFDKSRDEGVVYSPWCNQIRKLFPFSEFNPEEFAQHKKIIESLVEEHGVYLAVDPEHEDQVFGWICGDAITGTLHFLYVWNTFRRGGIGKALMKMLFPGFPKDTIYFTHPTRAAAHLRESWNLKYNPYAVRQ